MAGAAVDAGGGATTANMSGGDEIKHYRIHVSSKYLDLTRQKLELTRLPHETLPKAKEWWAPKSQVEPLIDFWLEQYSWRDQEEYLNSELPQFRTAVTLAGSEAPVRVHFIHVRSVHANAVPLLLIPPFPFTNLSLGHLVKLFTDPEDPSTAQPFHLVIPSLPGIGFSDALPNNTPVIASTAEMFNVLMARLSYNFYIASNAGSASASPAEIDWKLAEYLATRYPSSCLGTHFIAPPLAAPRVQEAPWEWTKWNLASLFHAPILGYSAEDFSALERYGPAITSVPPRKLKKVLTPARIGLAKIGALEPNTLAYALCDSPTGLLVFALRMLRAMGPNADFSPTDLLNFASLAWLPGPEAAMRLWAHCNALPEEDDRSKKPATRPRVAITVFLGGENPPQEEGTELEDVLPVAASQPYACPSWGNAKYDVVHTARVTGQPGLLAWERPEVIAEGARGLAKRILAIDKRLMPVAEPPVVTAPLEDVVVDKEPGTVLSEPTSPRERSGSGSLRPEAGPSTLPVESSWRLEQIREGSETPQKRLSDRGGADVDFDQGSPDTMVATPTGN